MAICHINSGHLIKKLTGPELRSRLQATPGAIPVSLDAGERSAVWLDLDNFHCQEGFFAESLAVHSGLQGNGVRRFASDLEFLRSPPDNALDPRGFIFHAGRCGSTVLARALARSPGHLVFSEAAPHNQFWGLPESEGGEATRTYRNLLLHMARPRLPSYRAHIVKFTSFNIVRFEFIRRAFPAVPALFLFRNPAAILTSYRRSPPAWLGRDPRPVDAEAWIECFFRAALEIRDANFRCLDYADLNAGVLPDILRFFGLEVSHADLSTMRDEFRWDAKSGSAPRLYCPPEPGTPEKTPSQLFELHTLLTGRATAR